MVTMLDCIKRSPERGKVILAKAIENTDVLKNFIPDFKRINEIILVGSGSSYNAIVTEIPFMEMASGIQTHSYLPNDFSKKSILNPHAMYVFVSQSGTSTLVKNQIISVNEKGYVTVAVTDYPDSPIAKTARIHVPLEAGDEEFGFRTVGFNSTILTLKLIAMRIGLENGNLNNDQFDEFIKDGQLAIENHPKVVERALAWFDNNKDVLKSLRSVMYYGGGPLHGIALEGALKLMETPKIYLSQGFEAEDGIHGPCYAFRKGDAIIFLNDGENDTEFADSMVRFSKNELGVGFMFGPNSIDDKDLCIKPASKYFREFEIAPAVQIVAYEMAMINDIPVLSIAERTPHVSSKYFQTHKG